MILATKKIDLRLTTPEARTELRRVAIRLSKKGQSKKSISEEPGIRRMTAIRDTTLNYL